MSRRSDRERGGDRGRGVGDSSRRRRQWQQWAERDRDETLSDDDMSDFEKADENYHTNQMGGQLGAHVGQQRVPYGGAGPSRQYQPLPNPNDFPVPIFQTPIDDIPAVRWPSVPTRGAAAAAQVAEEPELICFHCYSDEEVDEDTGQYLGPVMRMCRCRGESGLFHQPCVVERVMGGRDVACEFCGAHYRHPSIARFEPPAIAFRRWFDAGMIGRDPQRTLQRFANLALMLLGFGAFVTLSHLYPHFQDTWFLMLIAAVVFTSLSVLFLTWDEHHEYRAHIEHQRAMGNPLRFLRIRGYPEPHSPDFWYDANTPGVAGKRELADVLNEFPHLVPMEKTAKELADEAVDNPPPDNPGL